MRTFSPIFSSLTNILYVTTSSNVVHMSKKVAIHLFGVLKQITGKNEFIFEIDKDETVNTLILRLTDAWPKLRDTLIDSDLGTTGPNAIILVNGREIGILEKGMKTTLENEDKIVILPVVHGGQFQVCQRRNRMSH